MTDINYKRVLFGGLVAGAVLSIGEYLLNEVLFVKQLEETARRLNFARPGTPFNLFAVILTLLLGLVLVWLYAVIRTRFGPGPKTAVLAALIGWFCIYFYSGVLFSVLVGVPRNLVLFGLIWGLVEYTLATIAGAW